jgi:hypothetical protein
MTMRMKALSTIVLMAVIAFAAPAVAAIGDFLGSWSNVNASSANIVTVRISQAGTHLSVTAWAKCSPTPCAWGTVDAAPVVPGVAYGATFTTGVAVRKLGITLNPNGMIGKLQVVTNTTFTDNSGRKPYQTADVFAH